MDAIVEKSIERAGYALSAHMKAGGKRRPGLVDAVTDLLHYAEQGGDDPEQIVRDALTNWKDERS